MTDTARLGPPKSRGLIDAPWVRMVAGRLLAAYMRFVAATSRTVRLPVHRRTYLPQLRPAIFVSWHAIALTIPLCIEPDSGETVGLVSPHADGQLAAHFVKSFGIKTVYGTGVSHRQNYGTGGTEAFRTLLEKLKAGTSVYLTAEIPPIPGRKVSQGVIALARASGRPIVVISAASSRRKIIEKLWDKMQINLPFSRLVVLFSGPLTVDGTITDADARATLKQLLDASYDEAMRLADAKA